MAVSKLTCPECSTVLRPAKPVAAGKKVKCPRCETIFAAGGDADLDIVEVLDDDPPARKSPAKARAGKPAKPARPVKKAPKKPDEEEEGTYKFIGDNPDEEKPDIDYAPDMSIKDLRGPATVILVKPSTKLILVGFLGVLGWMALLILLLIPAVFPVRYDDDKNKMPTPGMTQKKDEKAQAPDKPGLYRIVGVNIGGLADLEQQWWPFAVAVLVIIVGGVYSSLVVIGAIRIQNLESRGWGMAASILAMLPIHVFGLAVVTTMVLTAVLCQLSDEESFINLYSGVGAGALYLGSLAVGVWNLMTLFNEDVIAGFEYVAE
jgi:predicted Zn finger-like uncharacterized protein